MKLTSSVLMLLGCAAAGCETGTPVEARAALGHGPALPSTPSFLDGSYNGRNYKLYVPSGYASAPIPLVVMLHGCTQTPADFAAGTQMNTLAENQTFFALYPEQSSSANANECWNWFQPASQVRGSGEPAEIVGMLDHVAASYQIDTARVYAVGLSAGGAMVSILGATYPDRFAAITIASGLEYKAATTLSAAFTAESSGGPSPTTEGNAAYMAMGAFARAVRVLVIYGTSDDTVAPVNGDQVLSQWAQTDDSASDGVDDGNIDDTADATDSLSVTGGHAATRTSYKDSTTGDVVLQKIVVTGMGHAWSGGSSASSYTDSAGPDATTLSWAFLNASPANPIKVDLGHDPEDLAGGVGDGGHAAGTDGNFPAVDGGVTMTNGNGGCSMSGGPVAPAWLLVLALAALMLRRRRVT